MATKSNAANVQEARPRSLLTVEYMFALGSVVVATLLITDVITGLFTIWTKGGSSFSLVGWLSQFIPQLAITAPAALVSTAVFAVVLGVLGLVLFSQFKSNYGATRLHRPSGTACQPTPLFVRCSSGSDFSWQAGWYFDQLTALYRRSMPGRFIAYLPKSLFRIWSD